MKKKKRKRNTVCNMVRILEYMRIGRQTNFGHQKISLLRSFGVRKTVFERIGQVTFSGARTLYWQVGD